MRSIKRGEKLGEDSAKSFSEECLVAGVKKRNPKGSQYLSKVGKLPGNEKKGKRGYRLKFSLKGEQLLTQGGKTVDTMKTKPCLNHHSVKSFHSEQRKELGSKTLEGSV